jgi:hypothetical protein
VELIEGLDAFLTVGPMREPETTPTGLRTGLQVLLVITGAVMVIAGLATVLFGAESVPGEGTITPGIDSEMRFYAVWYVVAGVFLLRSVRLVDSEGATIRLVAVGFFVAGCARALSWMVEGKPVTFQIVLMVIELALPLLVVPWQRSLAKSRRLAKRRSETSRAQSV